MTKPILQDDKVKLLEGCEYSFLVIDLVQLQDQNEYYLLADPNGMKHFMEAAPYRDYHIPLHGTVSCLVSKINCTGRIFLEPIHPILKTGQQYRFLVKNILLLDEKIELLLELYEGVLIKSILRNTAETKIMPSQFIEAKVTTFKKGLPEIEIIELFY